MVVPWSFHGRSIIPSHLESSNSLAIHIHTWNSSKIIEMMRWDNETMRREKSLKIVKIYDQMVLSHKVTMKVSGLWYQDVSICSLTLIRRSSLQILSWWRRIRGLRHNICNKVFIKSPQGIHLFSLQCSQHDHVVSLSCGTSLHWVSLKYDCTWHIWMWTYVCI